MIRRLVGITLLTILVMVMVSACSILQEPEEASAPIEAIPLEEATETPAAGPTAETVEESEAESGDETAAEPTAEAAEESGAESGEETAAEPTAEAAEESGAESGEETAAGAAVIFQINPDNSSVRFVLDEELRGQPKTVIGETNQVAGEIAFDKSDLSTAQVGIIQVNARTLATDNNFRNRALNNQILETGDYEFITFTPTAIEGLPDSVENGQSVTFRLVGDLTIRDITNQATFDVEATLVSDTELTGTASTIVTRADYDLNIPSVPNVANVEEEVELYIDFAISN